MAKKTLIPIGDTDQRILTRKVLNGEITAESLQAHLDSLVDVSDNAKEMTIPWEPRVRPVAAGGGGDAD